jgi:hypothetical protein
LSASTFASFYTDTESSSIPLTTSKTTYHDIHSLKENYKNTCTPLILSINTQSLNSKQEALSLFLHEISNINIIAIALQEVWQIPYPETLKIKGFKLITKQRDSKGGGVGFYIKDDINYKILDNLSPFLPRTFESISIEINLNGKKTIQSSVYRSPVPPAGTTANTHTENFITNLEHLMTNITATRNTAFFCTDSNINTLTIQDTNINSEYYNTIHTCGFGQCINKATRIQGTAHTLIDHIITNSPAEHLNTGVVISDISDHFITFVEAGKGVNHRPKPKNVETRNFSKPNIAKFKLLMSGQDWSSVTETDEIDDSYTKFWEIFQNGFGLCFPFVRTRFNKNINKIHPHMTKGLLVSRNTKLTLHKLSLKHKTPAHTNKYKEYRNVYTRLIKASKRLYYQNSFTESTKNPKKTWQLIGEALNTQKTHSKIEKIQTTEGVKATDKDIAEAFNKFFVGAGVDIANSLPPTRVQANDLLPQSSEHHLHFRAISQAEVVNTLRAMESKSSVDSEGISIKLLKNVALEISPPPDPHIQ